MFPIIVAVVASLSLATYVRRTPSKISPIARTFLIETMPDMVVVLDKQNRVVDINSAALKVIGQEFEAVIGRSVTEVFALWGDDFRAYQNIWEAQAVVEILASGKRVYLDMTISPIQVDGQLLGRLFVFRNVTTHKQTDAIYQETYRQLQARTQELETLRQMGLDLAATLNLEQVLATVMKAVTHLIEVDRGGLFLYRPEENVLELVAHFQNQTLPIGHKISPGTGLSGKAWLLNKPLLIENYQQWSERLPELSPIIGDRPSMSVPIQYGSEKIGVLTATAKPDHQFAQNDADLLSLFMPSVALAIHNAQLYEQLQTELAEREQTEQTLRQSEEWLRAFNGLIQASLKTHDLKAVTQLLADHLGDLFAADGCFITLWDEVEGYTVPFAGYGSWQHKYASEISSANDITLTKSVLELERVLAVDDVRNTPYISPHISARFPSIRSLMGLPLIAGDQKLGVALVAFAEPHHFTMTEIEHGAQVAQVVALAVARAGMYKDLHESEERYRDLFDSASDLIQSVDVNGRFLYVNQRWRETLGYTAAEVARLTLTDIVHPDHVAQCTTILQQLQAGDSGRQVETVFVSKTGQPFIVEGYLNAHYENDHFIATRGFFRNITERKMAEAALRQSEERLRSVIASMNDLVFVLDREGVFLEYYQPQQKDALYLPPEQFLGKSYTEVLPPTIAEGLTAVLQKVTQSGQVGNLEYSLTRAGVENWYSANISGRGDSDGQFDGVTIVTRDITAYKQAAERLRQFALHDSLTGLPNRRLLMEQLEEAIQEKGEHPFALLFLDLDRFKVINDTLGHQVGDSLLVAIAHLLEGCVRQQDTIARLGGDEFVVLLRHIKRDDEAHEIAERILEQIAQPFFLEGHTVYTSASIGLITDTAHYEQPEEALRHSDMAMYQAKMQGKASYHHFDVSQQPQTDSETLLRQRNVTLELLTNISRTLTVPLKINSVLDSVAEMTGEALDLTSVYICDWNAETKLTTVLAEYISPEASLLEKLSDLGTVYHLIEDFGDSGEWLQKKASYEVIQITDSNLPLNERAHMEQYGVQSIIIVPLWAGEQPIGYLEGWESRRQRVFHPEEIEQLQAIARQVAMGIHNAILYESVRRSEEQFRLVYELAPTGMAIVDVDGRFQQVNQALCSMTGYSAAELTKLHIDEITHPNDVECCLKLHRQLLRGEIPHFALEKQCLHKNGRLLHTILQVTLIRDDEDRPLHFVEQIMDITQRKEAKEQLRHNAFHDALTNLPNHALFVDHLKRAIGHASRNGRYTFAILFLDIDRFKVVNDSLGHTIGNELLKIVAQRLNACVRPDDTVARFGGDEFAVLLDGISHISEAQQMVEQIQYAFSFPISLDGHELTVTSSIGITIKTATTKEPEEYIRDAHTAMYKAKERGGDRFEIFHDQMHLVALDRLRLETELRQAIQKQELIVYYQPVISVKNGQIVKVEALLRWPHSQTGFIAPSQFIPLAEETGLINPIGQWLLATVCQQAKIWHDLGYPICVAVNISVRQFQHVDLLSVITQTLRQTKLPATTLELEITESMAILSDDFSMTPLQKLSDLGVTIAIDDFGMAYSSLNRLKSLPIHALKIDRSFIRDVMSDSNDEAIVKAIIAMARGLQLKVIAEGVETADQFNLLRQLHCDEVQGYLFSQPLPAAEMMELLHRWPEKNNITALIK